MTRDVRLLELARSAEAIAGELVARLAELRELGLVPPLDGGLAIDEEQLEDLARSLAGIPGLVERGVPVLLEERTPARASRARRTRCPHGVASGRTAGGELAGCLSCDRAPASSGAGTSPGARATASPARPPGRA